MKLSTFREIQANEGFIRASQSEAEALRVFGSNSVGRFFRDPGKDANLQIRADFRAAVIHEYGAVAGQAILDDAGFSLEDKKPLSVAMVKGILAAGDERAAAAQAERATLVSLENTRIQAARLPLTDLALAAADQTGLSASLDTFNGQRGAMPEITPERMITPALRQDIQARILTLADGGRKVPTEDEMRQVAREAIEASFQKKAAVVASVNGRNDLEPEHHFFALESALKNDYANPAAFERSYFRGAAPLEVQTLMRQKGDTSTLNLGNASVSQAFTALSNSQAPAAGYDPAAYFDQVNAGQDPSLVAYKMNAAVMGEALSKLPPDQLEARQALAHRMMGYQMKFAPVSNTSGMEEYLNPLGYQLSPLQKADTDLYSRSGVSSMAVQMKDQYSRSIGVANDNLHMVTDSRVMEVMKRAYALEQGGSVLTWGQDDL